MKFDECARAVCSFWIHRRASFLIHSVTICVAVIPVPLHFIGVNFVVSCVSCALVSLNGAIKMDRIVITQV